MTSRPGSTNVPAASSSPRGHRRRAGAAIVALLAVLGGAVVSTAAAAQEDTAGSDSAAVRIARKHSAASNNARPTTAPDNCVSAPPSKLDSGRIEFGLQQRQADDSWGARRLPRVRFFPTTATVDNWLASSSLTLTAPQTAAQSTSTYSAVTASSNHSCGLRTNGTITCWGTWAFRTA